MKVIFFLSFQGLDSSMYAGVNLLIAVGGIIMILGFLGCCGAIKESRCMLMLVRKKNKFLPLTDHIYIWWIESLQVVSNEDGEHFNLTKSMIMILCFHFLPCVWVRSEFYHGKNDGWSHQQEDRLQRDVSMSVAFFPFQQSSKFPPSTFPHYLSYLIL